VDDEMPHDASADGEAAARRAAKQRLPHQKQGKTRVRTRQLLSPEDVRRRNRRRPNYARAALRLAVVALVGVCAWAVFRSPRLWVRMVRVDGLQTVRAERVLERLNLRPRTNIVALPAHRLEETLEREPAIARATITRRLPDYVFVTVRERRPAVCIKRNRVFYTADSGLVLFRKERVPDPALPLIVLRTDPAAVVSEPRLGKRIFSPGLVGANKCLLWATRHPEFPLAHVVVDPEGKLCLNRKGGAQIQLGSGTDLTKKLNMLALLLRRRDEVRTGAVAYVNLYAHDAPAIFPRAAVEADEPGS